MFSHFQKQCPKNKPENVATVPEIIGQWYGKETGRRLSRKCRREKI